MRDAHILRRQFCVGLGATLAFGPGSALAGEPLVLVVGPSSKLRDISQAKLRRIFLNKLTPSPDGGRFIPLNLRLDSPPRERFDQAVLRMTPEEVRKYWLDQKIRGFKPPRTVGLDVLPLVLAKVKGTISYLPANIVDKLTAVSIDGRGANDSGYLLV